MKGESTHKFWSFNLGQLLVIITILQCTIIALIDFHMTRVDTRSQNGFKWLDQEHNATNERVSHLEWYKEQGVNFDTARKLGIKPQDKK